MHLGWLEILLIVGVLLLFFGPTRLPGLGRSLGSALRGFKRSLSGPDEPEDKKPSLPPEDPRPKV